MKVRLWAWLLLFAIPVFSVGCPAPERPEDEAAPAPDNASNGELAEPEAPGAPGPSRPKTSEPKTVTLSAEAEAAVALVDELGGKVDRDEAGRVIAVDLGEQNVSDEAVRKLEPLTNLRLLALSGTGISDDSMPTIAGLARLE
ncbi:MAG: hypothetical protein R6V30_08915, partial [Paracoccaceae bacterium]